MSAALTHLEPARGRPNLTVRAGVLVDRVRMDRGRALGVRLASGERIDGDQVVLAGGTYVSPLLLMRSGIGPAEELAGLDINVVADLPGVGRNLVDHPLIALFVPVPREPAVRPHYQAMVTWRSDGRSGPPDLHLFPWGPTPLKDGSDEQQQLGVNVGLLDPQSRGWIRMTSAEPAAVPHIDTAFLREPEDVKRFAAGIRELRRILATEPLASLSRGPELPPGSELPDEALAELLPKVVRTYFHPVGTCRMGPGADTAAVVDTRGRVHGLDNLIVADASIMPTVPRANTNLPTMMVAERIAGTLTGHRPWLTDTEHRLDD